MINDKACYLTSKEAANRLGFTPDYIRRLILNGKIKAEKLGANWLIKYEDISHIVRKRFRKPLEESENGSHQ